MVRHILEGENAMLRLRFLVCLLIGLLFSLVAFGAQVNNDRIPGLPTQINNGKPVEITVFGLPQATDAYDVSTKATVAVAQEFMHRYPNVRLKPFSFVKVPAGGLSISSDTDILMSMAAGTAADVLVVNFRQSDTYIRQSFLLPLDKYYAQWAKAPGGKEEMQHMFPSEELWKVIKRPGADGKTHIWTLPPSLLVMALNYRKDLLRGAGDRIRAVGLDPNKPPTNWDEFYQMCLQVCDPKESIYGFAQPNTWYLTWVLWGAGSEILDYDTKKQEWHAAYDDPGAVEAFRFGWKLVKGPWSICPKDGVHFTLDPLNGTGECPKCHTAYNRKQLDAKNVFEGVVVPQGAPDAWGLGKQAFNMMYMDDLQVNMNRVDPALIGVTIAPKGPGGKSSSELNCSMLAINGTVKDQAKIDAAWAYIRFRGSEVAKRLQTKMFVEAGFAKFLNPAWLRQFGYTSYLREADPGWEQTYDYALKHGHPEPYGKNAQQIYNEMEFGWGNIKTLTNPDTKAVAILLKESVARTNERLIGTITPQEKKNRDTWALVLVVGSLIMFGFLLKFTLNTYGAVLETPGQRNNAAMRRVIVAWIIMLPALCAVMLFQYYPLARGSTIAFQDYQIINGIHWVGLSNFGQVLFNQAFWDALKNSLIFAAVSLAIGFFAPVGLALLLHEIPRGSLFLRIVYFLPSITSGIVVMLLWKQMYDPSPYGILNQIFAFFHIPQQQFLTDPMLALFWVVIPGIWMGMGPGSIIYLAAMRQIPEDYYEAADVDGAGFFAKLRMITIPYLKPLLIINFVGACVGAFKSFEQIMIMTGGGPAEKTTVLGLSIWQNAFMYLRYGYATAMGWVLASLLIGFTIFQLSYLSKVQFRLAKSE